MPWPTRPGANHSLPMVDVTSPGAPGFAKRRDPGHTGLVTTISRKWLLLGGLQ